MVLNLTRSESVLDARARGSGKGCSLHGNVGCSSWTSGGVGEHLQHVFQEVKDGQISGNFQLVRTLRGRVGSRGTCVLPGQMPQYSSV